MGSSRWGGETGSWGDHTGLGGGRGGWDRSMLAPRQGFAEDSEAFFDGGGASSFRGNNFQDSGRGFRAVSSRDADLQRRFIDSVTGTAVRDGGAPSREELLNDSVDGGEDPEEIQAFVQRMCGRANASLTAAPRSDDEGPEGGATPTNAPGRGGGTLPRTSSAPAEPQLFFVDPQNPLQIHRRCCFLYIQLEYCPRTLQDYLGGFTKTPPADEIWRLSRQILEGLASVHAMGREGFYVERWAGILSGEVLVWRVCRSSQR